MCTLYPRFDISFSNIFTHFLVGTFRIRKGDDIMKVVDYALDAGYRLFGM